jgi:hypothetical protein
MTNAIWLAGFLLSFVVFVLWPIATVAPAVFFLGAFRRDRDRQSLLAAGSWLLYGLWELGMRQRILCTGECNIRIDLVVAMFLLERVSAKALGIRG